MIRDVEAATATVAAAAAVTRDDGGYGQRRAMTQHNYAYDYDYEFSSAVNDATVSDSVVSASAECYSEEEDFGYDGGNAMTGFAVYRQRQQQLWEARVRCYQQLFCPSPT